MAILDRSGLKITTCEYYQIIKAEFESLLTISKVIDSIPFKPRPRKEVAQHWLMKS